MTGTNAIEYCLLLTRMHSTKISAIRSYRVTQALWFDYFFFLLIETWISNKCPTGNRWRIFCQPLSPFNIRVINVNIVLLTYDLNGSRCLRLTIRIICLSHTFDIYPDKRLINVYVPKIDNSLCITIICPCHQSTPNSFYSWEFIAKATILIEVLIRFIKCMYTVAKNILHVYQLTSSVG